MTWAVGIIGCGRMGRCHAQAYSQHSGFHLSAVMNPDAAALEGFCTEWSIGRSCRTVEDLLAAEPLDAISLCSPSEFHFLQAEQILGSPRRPRLLFIEKPICLREKELSRIEELARQAKVAVAVNHTRRFDPAHRRLTNWTRSRKLGPLREGRCTYYGGWLNNGTHLVDLVRMLFPEEPQVETALATESGKGKDKDLKVDLRVGDALIHLEPFDETHYQIFEADLRFEKGRIRLLDFGKQVSLEEVQVNLFGERILLPAEGSPWTGLTSPVSSAVQAVAATLEGKDGLAGVGADLATAAETMRLVWAAQQMATCEKERIPCLP